MNKLELYDFALLHGAKSTYFKYSPEDSLIFIIAPNKKDITRTENGHFNLVF